MDLEDIAHRHQPDFLISQRGGTRSLFSTCSSSNNSGSTNSIINNNINIINNNNMNNNNNINNNNNNSNSSNTNCMMDRRSLPPSPPNALLHPLSIDPVKSPPSPQTTTTPQKKKEENEQQQQQQHEKQQQQQQHEKEPKEQSECLGGSLRVLPFAGDDGFCISLTPALVGAIPRGRVPCHLGCSMRDWSQRLQRRQRRVRVEFRLGVITTTGGKSLPVLQTAEVRRHTAADDLWLVIRGVVYDCTQFQHFHPGGGRLLLQCAGRDCTALYDYYHRWVSCEGLLAPFAVGVIENAHQQPQKK